MSDPAPTARRTLLAAGAAALAGGTLTACGGGEEKESGRSASGGASPAQASLPAGSAAPSTDAGAGTGAGKPLLRSAAVPVGGGTILKAEKLVVTQPTAGSFRCFTAVCTHEGCIVSKVENGTIDCPCHGSRFAITDGAVAHGPATRPLAEKKVTVAADGGISLA